MDINTYVNKNFDSFVRDLSGWLEIPSISSEKSRKADVRRAIDYAGNRLKKLGFTTSVWSVPGSQPCLFAQRIESKKSPTLLVYGHADVQPVDPLSEWIKPPFKPWVSKDKGRIYARGSSDDKGQAMMYVKACEYWIKNFKKLPLNVKFLIEGEEEIGSPYLEKIIRKHKDLLSNALCLFSDSNMIKSGYPAISYATRGLVYFEVEVKGPNSDLHSGGFGGIVLNPLFALVAILRSMVGKDGKILIPGFYKGVLSMSKAEKQSLKRISFMGDYLAKVAGVKPYGGEKGRSLLERVWARPTFEVHGIVGGFQDEGSKTVIPKQAKAKVSMRLVPKQDPKHIISAFKKYVKKVNPKGVKVSVKLISGGGPAFYEDTKHPYFKLAMQSLKFAFKKEPAMMRIGGSIFVPEILKRMFPKSPVIPIGFGLADDNVHAPNEWFDLGNFKKGIISSAKLMELLGK
ncbi:dipeptidase [Elusimicrobiota bacterium]